MSLIGYVLRIITDNDTVLFKSLAINLITNWIFFYLMPIISMPTRAQTLVNKTQDGEPSDFTIRYVNEFSLIDIFWDS